MISASAGENFTATVAAAAFAQRELTPPNSTRPAPAAGRAFVSDCTQAACNCTESAAPGSPLTVAARRKS